MDSHYIHLQEPDVKHFVNYCLLNGATIRRMDLNLNDPMWPGSCNPSIMYDEQCGRFRINVRNVNYVLHSSQDPIKAPCNNGYVLYSIPSEDGHNLKTRNFICSSANPMEGALNFNMVVPKERHHIWEFWGEEDVRLVRWEGKLYATGVRRDDNTTGMGRMELTELNEDTLQEISAIKVKAPGKNDTYCEKNWMPIKDMPYHYMRTSNPTEIVQVDPTTGNTSIVVSKERKSHLLDEHFDMLRGSSQVIPWKDYHIALVHTCELWLTANDRKYARYCHCFVVWDKDWDIVKVSPLFSFADYNVEFTCGLEYKDGYFYIPFALQDNFSFLMRVDEDTVWNFITNTNTEDADTAPFIGQPGRFDVIFNPHADQKTLFNVGMRYYNERNFAAAYCIFMRSADIFEYTYDERFMAARSIADLGHRDSHESGMWNLAIMHDRKRPEAYMSEAMYYHCRGRHPEALYYATLAMENRNNVDHLLYINDESMEYFNSICRYESVHYPEVLPYFDAHGMNHNQNRRVL